MWTRILPHIPLVQVAGGHQFGQPVNVFSAAPAPDCGSAIYPKLEWLKDRMLECCWGRKIESRGLMGILWMDCRDLFDVSHIINVQNESDNPCRCLFALHEL